MRKTCKYSYKTTFGYICTINSKYCHCSYYCGGYENKEQTNGKDNSRI